MRLWTLHPKYLDGVGLVALWREALLARAVLRGQTVGYRHHPQLQRFHACGSPRSAINAYLGAVHAEACSRGYAFDRSKLTRVMAVQPMFTTDGQLKHEWAWLLDKLRRRNPTSYRYHRDDSLPVAHPLFRVVSGPVCHWERIDDASAPRRPGKSRKGRTVEPPLGQ